MVIATSKRIHCTTARSRLATATTRSLPTPGQEKTLSTTTAPAISVPTMKPMMVTVGMAAFGKAWPVTTARQGTPLALAVRIKGCPRTSSMALRVKRANTAAPPSPRVITGRMPWRQPSCPPDGSQPSCTAKTSTSSKPSTKEGTVKPATAMIMTTRSASELRCSAA